MDRVHTPRRAIHAVLILVMLAVSLSATSPAAAKPDYYTYANGITLPSAVPLPIFQVAAKPVNTDEVMVLTRSFSGIFNQSSPHPDTYNGMNRFTMVNELPDPSNNTLLEQFAATGGFYAYNPLKAFGSDLPVKGAVFDKGRAQTLACDFLLANPSLIPPSQDLMVPGLDTQCSNDFTKNPLYPVSIETLSGQNAAPQTPADTDIPLRAQVTVPVLLMAGNFLPGVVLNIPLGGPGGHISMIFNDTSPNGDPVNTLDNIVGLQAVAMPGFGRSFTFSRLVPAVDPAAEQQILIGLLKKAYPGATDVVVPPPALEYYLTDAGTPQKLMQPILNFSNIHLTVNGQMITLKDMDLPAVQQGAGGVGPTVSILSPKNGSGFLPGQLLDLQGSIKDGAAPYIYDWQLDDGTSLGGGTLAAAGNLPAFHKAIPLPVSKGQLGTQALRLLVTDNEGATTEAEISLNTPMQVYLPDILRGTSLTAAVQQAVEVPAQTDANYTFGVEYGSDYPPYGPGGPDLSGVPPDANGLSSSLFGLGWSRVFNWYNSLAWEKDWRDCSLGGGDCSYGVDRADYVYYSGHGNNGGIAVPSDNHDSGWADGSNARFSSARWVGFSSCLTLRAQWSPASDAPIRRWFNAFQGAHMLLGFNSVMGDIAFGGPLVDNMRLPSFTFLNITIEFPWAQRTIAEAWVQTAFEMNAGKPAYIYATSATVNPVGNKLPKPTDAPLPRPYPVNWFYWVWWDE